MSILAGLLSLFMVAQGCSIYKAATAAPPVPVENVRVGSNRPEVLSVFGMPKSTESLEGERTEIFEFTSGLHEASKARIVLYIAGDVFTLGLAELVFWPMELAVLDGSQGRAIVTYSQDNIVKVLHVTKKDGAPWGN